MKLKMKYLLIVAILGILLSACAPQSGPTPVSAEPTAVVTPAAGSKDVEKPGSSDSLMIVLERSGGFAGDMEKWSIYSNGNILTGKGEMLKVDSEKVSALMTDIQSAGILEMKINAGLSNSCRDCFNYSLTVNQNGKPVTFTAIEGVEGAPPEFWQIVGKIQALAAEAR